MTAATPSPTSDTYRDDDGSCWTCWSVAQCTKNRVRVCRWCRGDAPARPQSRARRRSNHTKET